MTESDIEENKMFWETYETFTTFLKEKTNVSILRHPEAEADDLIARFIHLHPNDTHYIVSSDSDYLQLIDTNVFQYNGVENHLVTLDGYFKDNKKPVLNKDKTPKLLEGKPDYILFKKIIRGDSGDNVFSAYPGVREKGTKNTIGILDAYEDRDKMGYHWNNFMLQRWTDHNGIEHRVKDRYELNKTLIDLKAQPQEIKDKVDEAIRTGVKVVPIGQVGIHLMRFANRYELNKILDNVENYSRWLNSPYKGTVHETHTT
jgi:5'-3' exonuclease